MLVKKLKTKILALISVFFLSFSFSMAALDELGSGSAATQQNENDNEASITIGSFAYVLTVLGIIETEQMSFGAFTPGSGGTIDTSGSVTDGVVSILGVADIDDPQKANITMTGDPSEDFNLKINGGTDSSVTLTHETDATQTMTLAISGSLDEPRSFDGSGSDNREIAGTLTVGDSQLAGLYSGTYTVEIMYISD